MNEHEVRRTLTSLVKKHQKTFAVIHTTTDDDLDAIPLPEPPEWPSLDSAALHGQLGEIVTTMEPETEADPVGILLSTIRLALCFECNASTIRRWARNGTMPKPLKVGGRTLWDAEEICAWILQPTQDVAVPNLDSIDFQNLKHVEG